MMIKNLRFLLILLFSTFIYSSTFAQWTTDNLSIARKGIAATPINGQLYFVGGTKGTSGPGSNVVDIYNPIDGSWGLDEMSWYSAGEMSSVTTGEWTMFGYARYTTTGRLFLYNSILDEWTDLELPGARSDYTMLAIGDRVMFAGGRQNSQPLDIINVYNLSSGTWTIENLSQARRYMGTAVVGNKAYFIAGDINAAFSEMSNVVDVFDNATGTWSTFTISESRKDVGVAVLGNQIIIAGGITSSSLSSHSDAVDYIDTNTQTSTSGTLPFATSELIGISTNGKTAFVGGPTNKALIFDSSNNSWSEDIMYPTASALPFVAGTTLGNKMFFVGGSNSATGKAFIYDTTNDTWENHELSSPRHRDIAVAAVGNKVLFAGGKVTSSNSVSTVIDIYTDPSFAVPLAIQSIDFSAIECFGNLSTVMVAVTGGTAPYTFNVDGGTAQSTDMGVDLAAGVYNIAVTDADGNQAAQELTITQPNEITITETTVVPTQGNTNGSIALNVQGGTPPYIYLWSNGSTTDDLNNLPIGTYDVVVTDDNNCTAMLQVDLGTTSTKKLLNENAFRIFPNPADEFFVLENLNIQSERIEIKIINALGIEIKRLEMNQSNITFSTSDFPNGIYFVEILTKEGMYRNKILEVFK